MRKALLATTAALGALIAAGALTPPCAQAAQTTQITQLPYPAEVSLVQDPMGWTYRQNNTNLPLYLYEPASSKSHCSGACERQWAPLLAPANAKPLGDWSTFVRSDGRPQWAFQQHPVYTHLPDAPARSATRTGGLWHLMPHFQD